MDGREFARRMELSQQRWARNFVKRQARKQQFVEDWTRKMAEAAESPEQRRQRIDREAD